MSLTPGTRIGVYDVVEMIGVGGMGEVYRARDWRLDRDVALKTLPDEFARDPERLSRFEREAKSLAQLNHPHIASIYGLETGSPTALAMEMVEGETLADRVKAGPLPLDEALVIARQLCAALDHAHGRGIVHRDLKPANIKAGPRDAAPHVKVLDFGLAKAMLPDASPGMPSSVVTSPTITSPANMTRAGIILGTAAYMAPEQARGKQVDQRADIWAFGCVLFEMLTARRPFDPSTSSGSPRAQSSGDGESIADVLAAVLTREPDWTLLPSSTPRGVRVLLERCLRKDPAKRIHAIADVGIDLDDIVAEHAQPAPVAGQAARRWPLALTGAVAGAALAATVLLTIGAPRPSLEPAPTIRFTLSLPDGWTQLRTNGSRQSTEVSPDGQKVATVLTKGGERRVFIRRLDDSSFRELAGSSGARGVFWAPDSEQLGFVLDNGAYRRTDLNGSSSQPMATIPNVSVHAAWGPDNEILSAQVGGPLWRWSVTRAAPPAAGELPQGVMGQRAPKWLPAGHGFMFIDLTAGADGGAIMIRRPQDAPRLVTKVDNFRFSRASYASGHLLLSSGDEANGSTLTAQPLDLASATLTGEPIVLAAEVDPWFSASDNGVLVIASGRMAQDRFVWVDARGDAQPTRGTSPELRRPASFDLSADQRLVVVQQHGASNPLLLHDLARGVTTMLAVKGTDPVWSPDGKQVAFSVVGGDGKGVHVVPAFGGASRLLYTQANSVYLDDWSRDGRWLAGHVNVNGPGILIPTTGDAKPILFEQDSGRAVDEATFSPDGRWLAYNSVRSANVYLSAVPPTGERWQVSVAGGAQPRWRADGKALYFLSMSGTMITVDVATQVGAPPQISAPRALFETGLLVAAGVDQYRVNPDGTRFLLRRPDETAAALDSLEVIVNWPGLLKK